MFEVGPGDAELARLRARLWQRGLRLMLDFVPNHMALDHPWVETHPEFFVAGTDDAAEDCGGTGRIGASMCPNCGGSGKVIKAIGSA